ncbi:MAG: hypothetical protein ACFE9R_13985 [Candidatus Hermodarchaeota archaeon]
MADFHTKTFYGNKTSIVISSPSKSIPYIFLSCLHRKEDGSWEKTFEGEGNTVKLSIEEIICILEVLNRKSANWRGFHVFRDRKTEIYVGWEDESRQVLRVKLGTYTKKLRFPNTSFLSMLLEHILTEKIEFATSGTAEVKKGKEIDDENEYGLFTEHITSRDGLTVVETTEYGVSKDTTELQARIKVESPKALLITLDNNLEFWIPKSTIHSSYDINNKTEKQSFIVDKWIVERNKIIK